MKTLREERELKKTYKLLKEVLPAVNFAGLEIGDFISANEDIAVDLFDAEVLLRMVFDKLEKVEKSVRRRLRNCQPRKMRRAKIAQMRLKKKSLVPPKEEESGFSEVIEIKKDNLIQ